MGNRIAFGVALSLVIAPGVALAQEAELSAAELAFVEWVTETAIPLPAFAGATAPEGVDLSPFDEDFERARFVYLGEPDHYIAEKYAFRSAFLAHLFGMGWRQVCMEMGRADGVRVNRYLETGDARHLADVGVYRVGTALTRADGAFADVMRGIGTSGGACELSYFGYDVDTVPGSGFDDVCARLEVLTDVPFAGDLLAVARTAQRRGVLGETPELDEWLENWDAIDAELAPHLPDGERDELYLDIACLRESGTFAREIGPILASGVTRYPVDAFARREETMFANFDGWNRRNAGEKLVVMGHNMHVAKTDGGRMRDHGHALSMWPCIGAHIARNAPDDVFAVWLLYDHGMHKEDLSSAIVEVESAPGTLEALLARVPHETFVLRLASDDPRSAWLDEEREFKVNGTSRGYAVLRQKADAIVFTRESTAL